MSSDAVLRGWEHVESSVSAQAPVAHPTYEITWIERGAIAYEIDGRSQSLEPGAAFIVPPGTDHRTIFHRPMCGSAIHVGGGLLAEALDAVGPGALRRVGLGYATRSDRVIAIAELVRQELVERGPGSALAAASLLEALLIEVARVGPEGGSRLASRDRRVAAALDRIHAELASPLTIDDLARTAAMSRFHFGRVFREEVGEAPYRYLLRARVARAHEMLTADRASVTEAAFSVGFSDVSRFIRAYRTLRGRTPGEVVRAAARARKRRLC